MGLRLENEWLAVDMARPGQYDGSRFDWTGFVRQVRLKEGNHTFCAYESLVPGAGSGGIGLCNEFGIDLPVGYEDAAPGEPFPKIGTGLLTRPDRNDYHFFRPYSVRPFPVSVEEGEDRIRFRSEPLPCNGYAFRLEKEVSLRDNTLTMAYELNNAGERRIVTNEYVHNFLAIDNRPIGREYRLRLPGTAAFTAEQKEGSGLVFAGGVIGWDREEAGSFQCRFPGYAGAMPFYWELAHREAGVGVREQGSAPASALALWGLRHVVSPEVFVDVRVEPGEKMRWSRTYTFFNL